MGKIIDLPQLAPLQHFSTEFSTLGDDYVFTRITESDRTGSRFFNDGPVRFDGMSWMLCFNGEIDIEINLVPIKLKANTILVVRPGCFIEVKDVKWSDLDCYTLFVSKEFIRDVNFDLNILGSLPKPSMDAKRNPVLDITSREATMLKEYFDILHHNTENVDIVYSKSIARSILAALTYQLMEIISRSIPMEASDRPRSRRSAYVSDFIDLVHEHHRRERSVQFYADRLFISPKYLSLMIKEAIGRSAAEIIDDYVILEAKNLLRFSGKNIQQISYELNFPNQSSFGKYFKHIVGMSPSDYQRSV